MRIVVTIQHPGHVHFFKHAIQKLERNGHQVSVFARENEMTRDLLDHYGIEHEMLVGPSSSLVSLPFVQAAYEMRLLQRARHIEPDVITAIGGVAAAHVATLLDARSVVFYDTEHAKIITSLSYPFADLVCTPACYRNDVGDGHVRYPGYHELAYLHPNRFSPDEGVREELGVGDDPLVICRFSSWDSSHDLGQGGFSSVSDVIETLEDDGAHVVVSSEIELPSEFAVNRMPIGPHRMHDLLATADIVVSEGATTAAEAAVLGTPAIYVNSLRMGYTDDLESTHGLLYNCNEEDRHQRGLELARELLAEPDAVDWKARQERLHRETVDVTDVIVTTIETAARWSSPQPRQIEASLEA